MFYCGSKIPGNPEYPSDKHRECITKSATIFTRKETWLLIPLIYLPSRYCLSSVKCSSPGLPGCFTWLLQVAAEKVKISLGFMDWTKTLLWLQS